MDVKRKQDRNILDSIVSAYVFSEGTIVRRKLSLGLFYGENSTRWQKYKATT